MKKLLLVSLLLLSGCTSTPTYIKLGAGYKFTESDIKWRDGSGTNPISARIEVYKENGNVSYGISHHSQWFTGFPFNNNLEYSKTEVFVDYKFTLGGK